MARALRFRLRKEVVTLRGRWMFWPRVSLTPSGCTNGRVQMCAANIEVRLPSSPGTVGFLCSRERGHKGQHRHLVEW